MAKTCALCTAATSSPVGGYGSTSAKLIVIGEFPSTDDEVTGIPFSKSKNSKRDGAVMLIRDGLANIGLDVDNDVYFTFALKCNPFHHKDEVKLKKEKHIDVCKALLEKELQGVPTPVVLALGKWAVTSLLDTTSGVGANRVFPKQVTFGGHPRRVIVTYSTNEVERRSIWVLNDRLERIKRLSPRGSALSFFKQDLLLVQRELQKLNLLPTT